MEKKEKGQNGRSYMAGERNVSRKGDELVKRTSKQPKSKINLQKHREVPVKRERETIWECQAAMWTVYLVKPLTLVGKVTIAGFRS